jgi:ABC-type glycerol-3-phosphate transport system substrate-binding protein
MFRRFNYYLSVILFSGIFLSFSMCRNSRTNINIEGYKPLDKVSPSQLNFLGHWLGEGKKEQLLNELINEFEFVNQNVKINMKYPEEIYFDRRKLNIEVSFNAKIVLSDKPEWDIIRLNNEYSKVADSLHDPEWTKKYLVDFSEIPEFCKNTKPELLTDNIKAQYGGIIPGPFIDGYNWALWCNMEVAKKVGIEVKQFDMTADDFMGYIKAVYDYNKGHNDSIIPLYEAFDWSTSQTIAQMLFYSEIGDFNEITDFRYSDKKFKALEKVLRELEKLAVYKPLPSNYRKITWTETVDYPLKNKCLFYSNASWMYNMWMGRDSVKLKNMMPTELPVFKKSPAYIGGYFVTWAVLKKSPNRDKAVRFLLSINKPDVAEKWSRYTKSPTGIKGNLTTFNFGFDKFENYQYMIERKYDSHKTMVYSNSIYCLGKENENVPNYFLEVFSGQMTADQALNTIIRQLKRK